MRRFLLVAVALVIVAELLALAAAMHSDAAQPRPAGSSVQLTVPWRPGPTP